MGLLHLTLSVSSASGKLSRLACRGWCGSKALLAPSGSARPGGRHALLCAHVVLVSVCLPGTVSSLLRSSVSSRRDWTLHLMSDSSSYHASLPLTHFCLLCPLCIYSERKGPRQDVTPRQPASRSLAAILGTAALCLGRGFGWFGWSGSLECSTCSSDAGLPPFLAHSQWCLCGPVRRHLSRALGLPGVLCDLQPRL